MHTLSIKLFDILSQTDWNNGEILCELVRSLGGPIPGLDNMSLEQEHWESNISMGKQIYIIIHKYFRLV